MSLWTATRLRPLLSTRGGVAESRARVRPLLHDLGLRQRRLRPRQLTATLQEPAAFVTDCHLLLQAWPDEGEVLVVDEAPVRRPPTRRARWCLGADSPAGPTADEHTRGPVSGAVAPLTGPTPSRSRPPVSTGAVAMGLRQWERYSRGKHVLSVPDRAAPHQGQGIDKGGQAAQGRRRLMPPPSYAPERTPQERLWQWRRRVVPHQHGCATRPEARQAIRAVFCSLAGRQDDVRQLCAINTPASFVALL